MLVLVHQSIHSIQKLLCPVPSLGEGTKSTSIFKKAVFIYLLFPSIIKCCSEKWCFFLIVSCCTFKTVITRITEDFYSPTGFHVRSNDSSGVDESNQLLSQSRCCHWHQHLCSPGNGSPTTLHTATNQAYWQWICIELWSGKHTNMKDRAFRFRPTAFDNLQMYKLHESLHHPLFQWMN